MQLQEIMLTRCDDLRAKLLELNLPTAGKKRDLQDRLLAHFGIQDGDDNNDSDGAESVATALDCAYKPFFVYT